MNYFIFFFCLFLLASCKQPLTKEKTESKLMESMSNYLNNEPKSKGKINFTVNSVAYFEDKDAYLCEFKVRMLALERDKFTGIRIDTTGIMKAKITKNFSSVNRIY